MGGMFSGRKPSKTAKPLPEEFVSLDIRELQKHQGLDPGQTYNLHRYKQAKKCGIFRVNTYHDCLELEYTSCEQNGKQFLSVFIEIVWSSCHFGGRRPWFLCPGEQCSKRVAILYGPQQMLCRHCRRIAYESQRENQIQRMFRKLRSIEASYPGFQNNSPPNARTRPMGMHHRTFQQLQKKHQRQLSDIRLAQVLEIEKLDDSLPDWF